MKTVLRPLITLFILLTVITGLIYPLLLTGIGQFIFPFRVGGSLIAQHNHWIGSQLLGQSFTDTGYFWGRPSATQPYPYNAMASQGSNLGPLNPALLTRVKTRIVTLQQADPHELVPIDLVTSSGSGLDPDISPAAAFYQASRVAHARGLPVEAVQQLINQYTQGRQLFFLGEPRVNVLALNLALDSLYARRTP